MPETDETIGGCATRYSTGVRIDLVDPDFLVEMGKIMHVGAQKYGELNWKKGLSGEKGGVNHAFQHLTDYVADKPCDYGPRETHLAQVAINAMFEFHFERQRRLACQNAEAEMQRRADAREQEAQIMASKYAGLSRAERAKFIASAFGAGAKVVKKAVGKK